MFTTIRWYGRDNKERGIAKEEKNKIDRWSVAWSPFHGRLLFKARLSKLYMITIHARCRLGTCVCVGKLLIYFRLCVGRRKKKAESRAPNQNLYCQAKVENTTSTGGIRPTAAELLVGRLPRLPRPSQSPERKKNESCIICRDASVHFFFLHVAEWIGESASRLKLGNVFPPSFSPS
jgi:hypothetical protein